MKTKMKRICSVLLAAILAFSAIGLFVYAEGEDIPVEGADIPTEPAETLTPESIPNDLLLDVNFKGNDRFAPQALKQTGGIADVAEDGKSVVLSTVRGSSSRASHQIYWGGLLNNMKLANEACYTITFALTNTGGYRFGIFTDYNGTDVAASSGFSGTPDNISANGSETAVQITDADEANGTRYYCVEVDGISKVMNFYVLSGGTYQMVTSAPYRSGNAVSENLALVFYLYGGVKSSAVPGDVISTVTLSDCKVYSGLFRGKMLYNTKAEANGTLLLEIPDLSKDAFNPQTGVGYRQTVGKAGTYYQYDAQEGVMSTHSAGGSNATKTYGGTTNLLLGEGCKYTLSFYMTKPGSSGAGIRISYEANKNSVGCYMQAAQACIPWGTSTTAGYSGYVAFGGTMLSGSTAYCHDGFAKVDMEISGTVLSIYINDVFLMREDIANPSNTKAAEDISKQLMSETLTVVLHDYFRSTDEAGKVGSSYKNLRIYSGLLHQENYDLYAVTAQTGTVKDGKVSIRFVGGGDTVSYGRVGLRVVATYGENSDTYEYFSPEAYRKLTHPRKDETVPEISATGEDTYLFGYTLTGVPADMTITFTVSVLSYRAGNVMTGETVTYVLENGILKS